MSFPLCYSSPHLGHIRTGCNVRNKKNPLNINIMNIKQEQKESINLCEFQTLKPYGNSVHDKDYLEQVNV